MVGRFYSSSIIFGSDSIVNFDSTGNTSDLIIIKYDSTGNVLWAKSAGGMGMDNANSVDIDSSGNIYLVGDFASSTITFDTIILMNSNIIDTADIFLVKYDSNGNVLWAKSGCGTNYDYAQSVAVSSSGIIYITGNFFSSIITFGSTTLTNVGTNDIFIVKYDTNGTVLWAKSAGGLSYEEPYSVAIDISENAYITGGFRSKTVAFDSTNLTNADSTSNTYDIFVAKYNTSGNLEWAKRFGGTNWDEGNSIALDTLGNIYVAGIFSSFNLIFDSDTLTNAGYEDIFLVKYDINGKVFWAKSAGGADGGDWANSLSVDDSGNSYVTGVFQGDTLTLGTTSLVNADNIHNTHDVFLAKYNTNGNVIWATSAKGTDIDWASSVAHDAFGNIYVGGTFRSPTITFGINTLSNVGYGDIFLAKLDSSSIITEINYLNNSSNISIFPNPSSDYITVSIPDKATIEILNINGQIISSLYSDSRQTTFDLTDLNGGIYIVRVKTDKEIITKKFIKE